MERNKADKLPKFGSLDKLVKYFDTHDLGDYLDVMPEARFEVNIRKRRHLFSLDEKLGEKLTKIAKTKHISSEKLINAWLKEKLREQAQCT